MIPTECYINIIKVQACYGLNYGYLLANVKFPEAYNKQNCFSINNGSYQVHHDRIKRPLASYTDRKIYQQPVRAARVATKVDSNIKINLNTDF